MKIFTFKKRNLTSGQVKPARRSGSTLIQSP